MESVKNVCKDCATEILVDNDEIKNGVFLSYENGDKKINVFKCTECYAKNKSLTTIPF